MGRKQPGSQGQPPQTHLQGGECCILNASRKSNGDVWSALRWYFIFYLRRGELPGCLLRLQRGVAPNAYRLALLYAREASKLASYRSGSCGYLCIALGSGGTICLSPVFKLTLADDVVSFPYLFWRPSRGFLLSNAYNCLALLPSSQYSPISLLALMSQILESSSSWGRIV